MTIYTFHPFEKLELEHVITQTGLQVPVEIFSFKKEYSIAPDDIFFGTCIGNDAMTRLGDVVQISAIAYKNEIHQVKSDINLPIQNGCAFHASRPIKDSSELGENIIGEMECGTLYEKFGENVTIFRVVTDFGFREGVSIKAYISSVKPHYIKGCKSFVNKLSNLFDNR